jgi:hypothetical protein
LRQATFLSPLAALKDERLEDNKKIFGYENSGPPPSSLFNKEKRPCLGAPAAVIH